MSPYARRSGRRYAAGSQVVWGGWETKRCELCGLRVTLDQAAYHSAQGRHGRPFSVHAACGTFASVLETVKAAA